MIDSMIAPFLPTSFFVPSGCFRTTSRRSENGFVVAAGLYLRNSPRHFPRVPNLAAEQPDENRRQIADIEPFGEARNGLAQRLELAPMWQPGGSY
jgi:hypothetical protein